MNEIPVKYIISNYFINNNQKELTFSKIEEIKKDLTKKLKDLGKLVHIDFSKNSLVNMTNQENDLFKIDFNKELIKLIGKRKDLMNQYKFYFESLIPRSIREYL